MISVVVVAVVVISVVVVAVVVISVVVGVEDVAVLSAYTQHRKRFLPFKCFTVYVLDFSK